MTSWMDWLSKILKLNQTIEEDSQRGTILFGEADEQVTIPYRIFDESQSMLTFEEQFRTDFSFLRDGD